MSKINIAGNRENTNTRLPLVYRRPRCRATPHACVGQLAWRIQHLIRRLNVRYVARITAQILTSASLIAGGIIVGLNPFGAALGFTGFCLAFPLDEVESDEEYRQLVIAHFEERGKKSPLWARGGAR